MKEVIGGLSATISVPLMDEGSPMIPVAGSAAYTLLDHGGLPILGHTEVPITTDAFTTQVSVSLPADVNTIAPGKSFERRTLLVGFVFNGETHRVTRQYRIVPQLNHNVTPDLVREFLGVPKAELSDDGIDITAAYFQVEQDLLPISLAAALTAGTIVELAAIEAIRMWAAIEVLPSLRQRIAQQQSDGVLMFRRPEIQKFDDIERKAWERYALSRAKITGVDPDSVTLVITTTDADPITGA